MSLNNTNIKQAVDYCITNNNFNHPTHGNMSQWDVSGVDNMAELFENRTTFNHDIKVADDGQIGSASDADAITIASGGGVTFSQTSVHSASLSVKNGATSAGFIEFFEDSDNGTNKVTLIGPASTGDITLTLGSTAGTIATTADIAGEATALAIALG